MKMHTMCVCGVLHEEAISMHAACHQKEEEGSLVIHA